MEEAADTTTNKTGTTENKDVKIEKSLESHASAKSCVSADDSAEVNAASEAWLDWSLLSLHHIQFSEAPQQQHRQKKHSADKVSPGMLAEEAFYWYWYAQQRDFTDVVATDTKRKLVKKLQFLDLVQKAAESTFPCDEDVEQERNK